MSDAELKSTVRKAYAEIALSEDACYDALYCGGGSPEEASLAMGYSQSELTAVPEGANLGLGCGNPLALASLNQGDVVLDLGSGAGFDSFLAANQVGPNGKAIGVDMTPEMLAKARANAEAGGYTNVDFRLGELDSLPVADNSVDLVISNCVINLVPDQLRVFQEAFRVLKPVGRLSVSDTIQTHALPPEVLNSPAAKAACLSPATTAQVYVANLRTAGFEMVVVDREEPYLGMGFDEALAERLVRELGVPEAVVLAAARSMVSIDVSARKGWA